MTKIQKYILFKDDKSASSADINKIYYYMIIIITFYLYAKLLFL